MIFQITSTIEIQESVSENPDEVKQNKKSKREYYETTMARQRIKLKGWNHRNFRQIAKKTVYIAISLLTSMAQMWAKF